MTKRSHRSLFLTIGILSFVTCFVASLAVYGSYLDYSLRKNLPKVRPGMSEKEVTQILGRPTSQKISDIPGTYWSYRTDLGNELIDDNPDMMGYLVLEMSRDGRVVKVFVLK